MALHGDLFSYPLPELLQWLDGSRKTGTLHLSWEAGDRKIFVLSGQVIATASRGLRERVARLLELAKLCPGSRVLASFDELQRTPDVEQAFATHRVDVRLVREMGREELFSSMMDLTIAGRGTFHWTEDADRSGEDWVPSDMSIRELLFESLRWVDEHGDVEQALPIDAMSVRALASPSPSQPLLHRVILTLCVAPQNLGRLRLSMGMSRSSVTRRVFDLLRLKLVEVEGAPQVEADPVAEMLEKGGVLVREGQYDSAGIICASLLASDPADRRVREFARMVQREHVAALYGELPPVAVPVPVHDPEGMSLLKPEERQIAGLVNGGWDVSTLVLAVPARELDTLRTLAKLVRMGLVQLSMPLR
jgi:DNA-binding MarR family transcriptional regulator